MPRKSDEDTAKMNRAARLAIGNSGNRDGAGNLLGTTRGEKERGERILDEMVENKTISRRQADRAKNDAVQQAGGRSGPIARRFGR